MHSGTYNFDCPHCGQNIDGDPGHAGMVIDCPTCEKRFIVPFPKGSKSNRNPLLLPFLVVSVLLIIVLGAAGVLFLHRAHNIAGPTATRAQLTSEPPMEVSSESKPPSGSLPNNVVSVVTSPTPHVKAAPVLALVTKPAVTPISSKVEEVPSFAYFDEWREELRKELGEPDRYIDIPIQRTADHLEYTWYSKRDLSFESFDGAVYQVSMGKKAARSVLGLKIGDSEEQLRAKIGKRVPDAVQGFTLQVIESKLPQQVRSEPSNESGILFVLEKSVDEYKRYKPQPLFVADYDAAHNYAFIREKDGDHRDGWVPLSVLCTAYESPGRLLPGEVFVNRRCSYRTVAQNWNIEYRVRNGRISFISIRNPLQAPRGLFFQGAPPEFELERVTRLEEGGYSGQQKVLAFDDLGMPKFCPVEYAH